MSVQSGSNVKRKRNAPYHPKVAVKVQEAIETLANPKGSSLYAMKKFIEANYVVDIEKISHFIKKYLKSAVERGDLIQPKGKVANGSFKINKKSDLKTKVSKLKIAKPAKMVSSTPMTKSEKAANKPLPANATFVIENPPIPAKNSAKKASSSKTFVMKTRKNELKTSLNEEKSVSSEASFSNPKRKIVKKPKVSFPTKRRKSLLSVAQKGKRKKLILKDGELLPGERPQNQKSVKLKPVTRSTKAKNSKPGKLRNEE